MDNQNFRVSQLDAPVSYFQNLISSFSTSHPLRAPTLQALAGARFMRYRSSKQQDDLSQSILGLTEAMLLPLPRCDRSHFVQTFWNLTVALSIRAEELKQLEDVKCCIKFFRYLQDQPHGVAPDVATGYLVDALTVKVELEPGDVRGDIEEIADLCHKLLNSDVSPSSQVVVSKALVRVVDARFGKGSRWEEHKIIQFLREANMRLPILHEASIAVADSLLKRFRETDSIDDYEEGTTILDGVVSFRAPGDTPSPYQAKALGLASNFAGHQLYTSGRPDHLEEAIYRARSYLDVISSDHPDRLPFRRLLSLLQHMRGLDQVGVGRSVRDVHSSDLESPGHPSFQDLTTSLAQSNVDAFSKREHLDALIRILHVNDMLEIEDAIKYCRQFLASPLAGHDRLGDIASEGLGFNLMRAFSCTKKIEYLNEAISVLRDCYSIPGVQLPNANLISCLILRLELLRHKEDSDELMPLFHTAVNDIRATIPGRFRRSCQWAFFARLSRHPSTPTAYDYAISLMQASLTFSPTLHSQHHRLVAMRDSSSERLPLDYASYLIHRGQLEKAIETLERGRALMWSEMRGFRTSIDKIRTADSGLADKFAAVNRELEKLTLTGLAIQSRSNGLDGGDGGIDRVGLYGDLVVRQQRLLDDREKLISHIQTLPGFESFLKPPSFDTLRSAALHGPVIIINHCAWRSDIIILLHDSLPSLIPTSDDFYGRINELQDQLLGARKEGLESTDYEDALNYVLRELYELVGRPVIQRLNELHIPEQSRVWWCPTSALCSLPLHAMGPIPSDVGRPQYFLDLYIPSYTPTLSALIESNKRGTETLEKPSILLVLQPDEKMTQALDEMQVLQAVETQVTTLISARATPNAVLEQLRDHRFAHIVCHGILETGKPFEASFKLYAGAHLSLLEIVRSQLPDAEFAFLSACHTAELTEESVADEGLHLAAAMQYCGFRSVVGTMWAMADTDGRDLAGNFYKSVFSGRRKGVRHYERTAGALRDAVQRLRRKRGITSERWVNFVHYGA